MATSMISKVRSVLPSRRMQILAATVVVLAGILLLLRLFVVSFYSVPNEAMAPTFAAGDRIVVDRRDTTPELGELVLFVQGEGATALERVIGLEGQTIEVVDNVVTIDGLVAVEPYLDPDVITEDFGPLEVPNGTVFTMGDNRAVAVDGRVSGPVSVSDIEGTVMFVLG